MADSSVAITAGSGTAIDTRTESSNSNHRQVVVLGDPATNAGVAPVDVANGLSVSLSTLLSGEDQTNNVLKTEQRFSFSMVSADTQIKSGAGFLHTITFACNDAAPTAGSLIVYDSLTETGTVIFNHTFTTTPFAPCSVTIDASFATGLYAGFTTTADVNVTFSYR